MAFAHLSVRPTGASWCIARAVPDRQTKSTCPSRHGVVMPCSLKLERYAPGFVSAPVLGGTVNITTTTAYPFDESITMALAVHAHPTSSTSTSTPTHVEELDRQKGVIWGRAPGFIRLILLAHLHVRPSGRGGVARADENPESRKVVAAHWLVGVPAQAARVDGRLPAAPQGQTSNLAKMDVDGVSLNTTCPFKHVVFNARWAVSSTSPTPLSHVHRH